MIHQIRKERNLDNEIASFVNKLKTKKIAITEKMLKKEIQKTDGIGYYSSILYIFKGNHIKQNYGNFFTYSTNIKQHITQNWQFDAFIKKRSMQ
jgi:hypothetical protein